MLGGGGGGVVKKSGARTRQDIPFKRSALSYGACRLGPVMAGGFP